MSRQQELEAKLRGALAGCEQQKPKSRYALIAMASIMLALSAAGGFYYKQTPSPIYAKQEGRTWGTLTPEEKFNIRREAIQKFPQIKNIGNGVSWQPISEWLYQEKGIAHSNVRSLFLGDLSKYQ